MSKDLIVLVADKDMEETLSGLLSRPHQLGMHPINYDIQVHPQRDPGCLNQATEFLRSQIRQYDYAMVLFDYHGCGQEEKKSAVDLQDDLEGRLSKNGWDNRAGVIVLVPELEIWVWGDQRRVDECLGWAGRQPNLRTALQSQGLWPPDAPKPDDPKGALEWALRQVRKPRSSVIYRNLAETVSLQRCSDPGFARLREFFEGWFPLE